MIEQRWRAEGPTRRARSPRRGLLVAFALVLVAVPGHQLVADALARRAPHLLALVGPVWRLDHLQRWEQRLERESVTAEALRPGLAAVQYRWLRRGNEKVVVGRDGWLFYRPGVRHVLGPPCPSGAGANAPLTAVLAFRDALAARGVALIVLPVPDKLSLHPEALGRVGPQPPRNAGEPALFAALAAAGVAVADPLPTLWDQRGAGLVYLPGDTHWSPAGMALTARLVAERVRRLIFAAGPAGTLRTVTVAHRGDLWALLDLPASFLAPVTEVVIEQVTRPDGSLYRPEGPAPVVLLGDSFTNIFSDPALDWGEGAGLGERLAYELGLAVDVVALNDGGVNGSRARLAQQPERLTAARVVIWQFAVRDLSDKAGDWQVIPLARE